MDADADDVLDLVHQNLEKELYWKYFKCVFFCPNNGPNLEDILLTKIFV